MEFVYTMPEKMLADCSEKGSVEYFEYNTFTYEEDNKPLHKGAWVYLPYGYTENEKYNVLYLLHGGGVNEDWWFKTFPDTVTILDNMISEKICKPVIIVAPSYYCGGETDNNAEYITEHFHYELRRDLIPAIEGHYSTYAGNDLSIDNMVKTREHRGFAGLSLGSMTTYRAALYHNYDLFAYYGPFSGCCGPKGNRDDEVKCIQNALSEGAKAGMPLLYMLCCNGDQDIAYEEHVEIMDKAEKICPELKRGINYDFFTIPGGVHDMKAWQLHLYHALQVFF